MQWAWHRGAFESRLCRFLLVSCCSQPREVIHRRLKPMVEGQLTRCQPHVPVYHNAHFWASKGSLPSVVLFFRLLARLVRPNIPQFRSQTSVTQQPTRSIPTRPYSALLKLKSSTSFETILTTLFLTIIYLCLGVSATSVTS